MAKHRRPGSHMGGGGVPAGTPPGAFFAGATLCADPPTAALGRSPSCHVAFCFFPAMRPRKTKTKTKTKAQRRSNQWVLTICLGPVSAPAGPTGPDSFWVASAPVMVSNPASELVQKTAPTWTEAVWQLWLVPRPRVIIYDSGSNSCQVIGVTDASKKMNLIGCQPASATTGQAGSGPQCAVGDVSSHGGRTGHPSALRSEPPTSERVPPPPDTEWLPAGITPEPHKPSFGPDSQSDTGGLSSSASSSVPWGGTTADWLWDRPCVASRERGRYRPAASRM